MPNPIYNSMANQNNPFMQIMKEAQNLKNTFKGNPREEVQRLLQTGQMSQKTFNELSQIAQQVAQMMGKY